jgi:integrase
MKRVRHPPLQHPLAPLFARAIDSFSAALNPESIRHYHGTARNFLSYLGANHPELNRLDQLRREPHILGWMSRLRSQVPPLVTASYMGRLIALRPILSELAWSEQLPELAHLIRREDIPRRPQRFPRPLTPEQDELLQQEFLRRNDLGGNVFLLIRHTGMRIGECADLSYDCLRSTGPDQWAIHVPLGKLKTERMVPVDSLVCELVQRLRFFRFLDPLPPDGRLLARPRTKDTLLHRFRDYLHQVCHPLGLHSHRPASTPPYLCHRDASRRRYLSRPDEITRPHLCRHDDAIPRCRFARSAAGIRAGSFKTAASCSPAPGAVCSTSRGSRWADRFFTRCPTCARDVSARTT